MVNTPVPAAQIVEKLLPRAIYPGVDMARFDNGKQLMIAVTEKKCKADLDALVSALREVTHV